MVTSERALRLAVGHAVTNVWDLGLLTSQVASCRITITEIPHLERVHATADRPRFGSADVPGQTNTCVCVQKAMKSLDENLLSEPIPTHWLSEIVTEILSHVAKDEPGRKD